jgi:hypothetical protein
LHMRAKKEKASAQRTGSGIAQINVKLQPRARQERAVKSLSGIPGVRDVIQLFPDETDPELSRLCVVEIDDSAINSALEEIRHLPDVEYVEAPARRKLIW